MYVYVVWEQDTQFYKIGIAVNTRIRTKSLQCGNPHKLTLIKKVLVASREVGLDIEWQISQEWDCYKVRRQSEWYELDFKQITTIERYIEKRAKKAS